MRIVTKCFQQVWSYMTRKSNILTDESNICFICYTKEQREQCSKLLPWNKLPYAYRHTLIYGCSLLTLLKINEKVLMIAVLSAWNHSCTQFEKLQSPLRKFGKWSLNPLYHWSGVLLSQICFSLSAVLWCCLSQSYKELFWKFDHWCSKCGGKKHCWKL